MKPQLDASVSFSVMKRDKKNESAAFKDLIDKLKGSHGGVRPQVALQFCHLFLLVEDWRCFRRGA